LYLVLFLTSRIGQFNLMAIDNSFGNTPSDMQLDEWIPSTVDLSTIDPGILKYGVQKDIDPLSYDLLALEAQELTEPQHCLAGEWSGYCLRIGNFDTHGLTQIHITKFDLDDTFEGRGQDIHGIFNIRGKMGTGNIPDVKMTFIRGDRERSEGEICPLVCKAKLDLVRGKIFGDWGTHDVAKLGDFSLNRTPTSVYRFLHINRPYDGKLARDRWAFATQAVLHIVQRRLWSWRYFKARFAERNRFCRLWYCKNLIDDILALTFEERRELEHLEQTLHPADAQFYRSIARVHFKLGVHV
jgi:hypothetical protein